MMLYLSSFSNGGRAKSLITFIWGSFDKDDQEVGLSGLRCYPDFKALRHHWLKHIICRSWDKLCWPYLWVLKGERRCFPWGTFLLLIYRYSCDLYQGVIWNFCRYITEIEFECTIQGIFQFLSTLIFYRFYLNLWRLLLWFYDRFIYRKCSLMLWE